MVPNQIKTFRLFRLLSRNALYRFVAHNPLGPLFYAHTFSVVLCYVFFFTVMGYCIIVLFVVEITFFFFHCFLYSCSIICAILFCQDCIRNTFTSLTILLYLFFVFMQPRYNADSHFVLLYSLLPYFPVSVTITAASNYALCL